MEIKRNKTIELILETKITTKVHIKIIIWAVVVVGVIVRCAVLRPAGIHGPWITTVVTVIIIHVAGSCCWQCVTICQ